MSFYDAVRILPFSGVNRNVSGEVWLLIHGLEEQQGKLTLQHTVAVSLDVTGCLLDMNQEVIRVVLANKRDVWRSPDLFDLVEGYFDGSLRTLDFLATLDASLRRARDVQLPLHLALQRLHQRDAASDVQKPHAPGAPDRYARSLVELRRFKETGEPFTAELSAAFEAVYAQQLAMMSKIRQQKRQLDRSIRSVRSWRRASSVVFVATFAVLLVCSVVASAIASPPVAAALAAAASLPVGSMVDLSLKRYQEAHHGYKEVVGKMQVQAFIAVEDLDNIRVRVDRLAVQVSSMVDCIERTGREEEALRVGIIEEVKMKLEMCMEGVDDLRDQADRCSRDIRRARIVVLQKIIHPKS